MKLSLKVTRPLKVADWTHFRQQYLLRTSTSQYNPTPPVIILQQYILISFFAAQRCDMW